MARIIFDLEAIEDIKNKLGSLIQSGQKLESSDLKKLIRQKTEVLDENETIVFGYVRNNPGTSIQGMVDSLEKPSRGTIYKVLGRLKKYGMVIARSDDTNIQKHQLFVDNESLIMQVEKKYQSFQEVLFESD